jgi:hypothetical protein
MTADDQRFAAFAQELENVFKKHFAPGTRVAVAFVPPLDGEVRYVMNVQKPVGIALFEQAADLARKEMELPFKVVNPEKIDTLAQGILADPAYARVDQKQVVSMIYRELESTLNMEEAVSKVKDHLRHMFKR